jgi:tetrathionate reductase subunit B
MIEKTPAIARRKVLRLIAGAAALCGATALRFFGGAARAATRRPDTPPPAIPGYDWTKHRWAFGVDATRCIGCLSCVIACKKENGVPLDIHHFRTWVERYVYLDGSDAPLVDSESDPDIRATSAGNPAYPYRFPDRYKGKKVDKAFFVPKLCNHCSNPPCVQVCPVGASFRTKDGVVLVDQDYCIGCRYCVQACPYGARTFDEALGVTDKCTWCYHRITKGLKPACVEVCPAGARVFGDLNDPHSDISVFLSKNRVEVLKPEMGTHPNVYYVGIDRSVR